MAVVTLAIGGLLRGGLGPAVRLADAAHAAGTRVLIPGEHKHFVDLDEIEAYRKPRPRDER